jgi:hypothetical protein
MESSDPSVEPENHCRSKNGRLSSFRKENIINLQKNKAKEMLSCKRRLEFSEEEEMPVHVPRKTRKSMVNDGHELSKNMTLYMPHSLATLYLCLNDLVKHICTSPIPEK